MRTEFKGKLTPKDNKVIFNQSLPMPIYLKGDLNVELVLMQKHGITTVLPLSNKGSPIFAERETNVKLRLLVDLKKISTLIADEYSNNIHLVSTLSESAQHLAGKSLFYRLACSQALSLFADGKPEVSGKTRIQFQ